MVTAKQLAQQVLQRRAAGKSSAGIFFEAKQQGVLKQVQAEVGRIQEGRAETLTPKEFALKERVERGVETRIAAQEAGLTPAQLRIQQAREKILLGKIVTPGLPRRKLIDGVPTRVPTRQQIIEQIRAGKLPARIEKGKIISTETGKAITPSQVFQRVKELQKVKIEEKGGIFLTIKEAQEREMKITEEDKRKGFIFIPEEKLKIEKGDFLFKSKREEIAESIIGIQRKIEESKIKEREKELIKLERERDIEKEIKDFKITPKTELETIKSVGRKAQILGIAGATAIPQFLLSTSRLLISPEREIPELVKYVSSGDALRDIKLKARKEPEAFVGELIALYAVPKFLPKVKVKGRKKGLIELEKAKPSISVGISKVTGDTAELLIKTGRQTKKLKSETTIKYTIEKVGEGFQVTKGKGVQEIIKKGKTIKKDKVLYGKKFTFTGEGSKVTMRKVKRHGEILKEIKEVPKELTPTFGKIEVLPKDVPKPKLIKESFFGVSKPLEPSGAGWNLLVGGRVKKATFKEIRTKEGLIIRTTPKARVKPEAETISFIKRTIADKELKPFGIKRTLPKERRTPFAKTFKLELIKKQAPRPKPTRKQKLKELEKAKPILEAQAEIFGQAVERTAFRIKPQRTGLRIGMMGVLPLKTRFKSKLDQERFVLGQDISQVSLQESDNLLFDTRMDITTAQDVFNRQLLTPVQLLTPKTTTPTKEIPVIPIPIPKIPKKEEPPRLFFQGEKPEFKKTKGYDVEILRESTDPEKRRWERLNRQLLTQNSALSLGARESDKDISARFRTTAREVEERRVEGKKGQKGKIVKKAKVFMKVLDTKDKYYQDNRRKFRNYRVEKGKKIPLAREMIEKAKYRLDSPSEKRQIRQPLRPTRIRGKRTPFGF